MHETETDEQAYKRLREFDLKRIERAKKEGYLAFVDRY